jgi:serine/threonine-protein kinase RsbW
VRYLLEYAPGDQASLHLEHNVHLALESRFENIELVQVMLDDSLRRLECDEDTRYWVGIAVREAVANAIKHGNRQDPEKRVEVRLQLEEEHVVINVRDEGPGFDPTSVPDPLAPENLLKPDGRGMFYMGKFMDQVSYDFGTTGGTEVTLRKRLVSTETAPEKQEEDR